MCVILAKKCKLKKYKKEQWFLYKIRDRNYSPKYKLNISNKNGIETLFLTDQINLWSEGINSNSLMIVSAALDNHTDLDDNGQSNKRITKENQQKKANILKNALSSKSVDNAKKILIEVQD